MVNNKKAISIFPASPFVTSEEKTESKVTKITKEEKQSMIEKVEAEMREAARNLEFERATELRDILFELKSD